MVHNGAVIFSSQLFEGAITNGHINVLDWLKTYNYNFTHSSYNSAAEKGHLHILQWAKDHKHIPKGDNKWVTYSIELGHINILQWAINNKFNFNSKICYYKAIKYNNIAIFQLLHENGYNLDINFCERIIKYDRVDMLKYYGKLHDSVCKTIVKYDSVSTLQWIYDMKYKINDDLFVRACKSWKFGSCKMANKK